MDQDTRREWRDHKPLLLVAVALIVVLGGGIAAYRAFVEDSRLGDAPPRDAPARTAPTPPAAAPGSAR